MAYNGSFTSECVLIYALTPQVRNWLIFVEKLYQDNKYHNSTHAADVLQV